MNRRQDISEGDALSGVDGEIGRNMLVRIVQLETHLEYIAKKQDISDIKTEIEKVRGEIPNLKVWVLAGALLGATIIGNALTTIVSSLLPKLFPG